MALMRSCTCNPHLQVPGNRGTWTVSKVRPHSWENSPRTVYMSLFCDVWEVFCKSVGSLSLLSKILAGRLFTFFSMVTGFVLGPKGSSWWQGSHVPGRSPQAGEKTWQLDWFSAILFNMWWISCHVCCYFHYYHLFFGHVGYLMFFISRVREWKSKRKLKVLIALFCYLATNYTIDSHAFNWKQLERVYGQYSLRCWPSTQLLFFENFQLACYFSQPPLYNSKHKFHSFYLKY